MYLIDAFLGGYKSTFKRNIQDNNPQKKQVHILQPSS